MNPPADHSLIPRGWYCSLPEGHYGTCPTWPRWWNIRARLRGRGLGGKVR